MILRRVIDHVRAQNWLAVAIDFVIVILGVFLGIQLGNWNAAQADARLGLDYVERLTRDLRLDEISVRSEAAYYAAVLESVQRTDALLGAADADPRALVVNAYRASEISYGAPVRATWDEIVAAGHLDLLPDGAAGKGLSEYYAFDIRQDIYRAGLMSGYRQTVRKIIPMSIQIAMREGCSDVRNADGYIVSFKDECTLDADPAAIEATAAALKSDPDVAAELRYQYSFAVSGVLNIKGAQATLERGLAALGAAPKPPP
ncbi:MAG: hypothetical protein U5J99_11790 [Parvularculaceae bacterium]|nr:hypothetical protein [Parvularculaceae bacterium]